MSFTGLSQFDETIHTTNSWLKELMEDLGWEDRHRAYCALRATLHALRDRLPVDAAAHLAAQLPMLIRGFYYEGWRPLAVRAPQRTKREFVRRIERAFEADPNVDPERVVRAVFRLLARHISEGEIKDVRGNLPEGIRSLWRAEPWLDLV
jgi:uncharacterized protein (DUF2267 family)